MIRTEPDQRSRAGVDIGIAAPVFVIGVLLAAIFARWTPNQLHPFLRFDSGIFLYAGEQLRTGAALYRDVWDHKPPVIFYVNEAGLAIAGGSFWGVLALDYLFCAVFFVLSFREMNRLFGHHIAALSSVLGLLFLSDVAPHPNLGEIATLPPQAIVFALLARDLAGSVSLRRAAVHGMLLALLFWTRPNGISIELIYLFVTVWRCIETRDFKLLVRWAAIFVAAALTVSAVITVPAVLGSSWHELWYASFTFNQLYAGLSSFGERVHALVWLLLLGAQHGIAILALAGLVSTVWIRRSDSVSERVLLAVCAWFVLEILFAAYTGKLYGKNLIPCTMPVILLVGTLFGDLTRDSKNPFAHPALNALTCMAAGFLLLSSTAEYRQSEKVAAQPDDPLLAKVAQLSSPGERVVFWGAFPMDTIVLAKRRPGSRLFTSVPMEHGEAAYRALASTALADIRRNQPRLIVERRGNTIPGLFSSESKIRNDPAWDTDLTLSQKRELESAYKPTWNDTQSGTTIYVHR